jgi:hypothetical protein
VAEGSPWGFTGGSIGTGKASIAAFSPFSVGAVTPTLARGAVLETGVCLQGFREGGKGSGERKVR